QVAAQPHDHAHQAEAEHSHDKNAAHPQHGHGHGDAQTETVAAPADLGGHDHTAHGGHGAMVADYRRRFFVCLILTVPVLVLSPTIQGFFGLGGRVTFPRGDLISFLLSTVIFLYGGWPFLNGAAEELRARRPGMMTLIALAISVAFFYSSAVVYG